MLFKIKKTKLLGIILSSVLLFSACTQGVSNETVDPNEASTEAAIANSEEPTVESTPEVKNEAEKYISASTLNVRENPEATASIKDSLMKGSKVKILSEIQDAEGKLYEIGIVQYGDYS